MEVEERKAASAGGGARGGQQQGIGKELQAPSEQKVKRPRSEPSEFQTSPEFLQYLARARAESLLLPENRIYIARRDEKIMNVWRGLIEHNFMSCPVLTITERHPQESGHLFGFIDMMDIVRYISQHFDIEKIQREDMKWFDVVFEQNEWQDKTVAQLMQETPAIYSRRNPWHPVIRGYSLFAPFEKLARDRGVNRVPILDEENHLRTMVTQTQFLKAIFQFLPMIGSVKDKPLNACPRFFKPVICVKVTDTAMTAFNLMADKEIVGVGVVDEAGRLVGNVSVRDLRAIGSNTNLWWRLMMKCSAYCALLGQQACVYCKPTDTLETCIRLIHEKKVHRAYICDDQLKPIGICSIKDIISEILESV